MPGEPSTPASVALGRLLTPPDKRRFHRSIRHLRTRFNIDATTCPEPLPAPGLIVTPEIRAQCECYLPIADIAAVFNRLYSAALTYQPILSSTPFHNSMSWADSFAALPEQFQASANPGRLLESLLDDDRLLTRFLFASLLPNRFYGGIGRYPGQRHYIREWLSTMKTRVVHCLDAACGTGEDTYGLALLLSQEGFSPEQICIEGWTLEPLEVWAATYRRFPHDRKRELLFQDTTRQLFEPGCQRNIHFRCVDLTNIHFKPEKTTKCFDLIICNGLLGGPIINCTEQLAQTIGNMANLLSPGGILLAADNFHGGWKQKCPQNNLRALFEQSGLDSFVAGEGIGGLNPD
jgi:SAM-dependent methyltransferase